MLLRTPRLGSRSHPYSEQRGLSYKSGRCCSVVTGSRSGVYQVTICLKSCRAVTLPHGLNHPSGKVLLKRERSESSCGGSSGSTSGPPRVARMERPPANRKAGTWKVAVAIRTTDSKDGFVCFERKLRWAWLLESVRRWFFSFLLALFILGKNTAPDWAVRTISGFPTVYRNKCVFQEK